MNTNELHGWEKFASEKLADASVVQNYVGHEHFWQCAFSRRNFMVGAGGAAGLTIGNKLGLSALLQAQNLTTSIGQSCSAAPKPIPGGIQPFGPGTEVFHVFAPPGPGKEPSTITDFKGTIGLAALHGGGTGTDASGHSFPLFYSVDVRFMKGTYIGEDSKTHHGTFAFTWFDLFEGQGGPQVHDFSYGTTASGLFWTALIQPESVSVDVATGSARLCLGNSFVVDAHDLVNSLKRGATHQSSISFVVRWLNPTSRGTVRDTTNHFDLSFVRTSARLAWTASEKGFHYHSDADDSVTDFAEIGNEQNGIFFV